MSKKKDIPVYLFTGFLEAGKTRFIQETMEDKRFCNGERTLLLVCEEGEEEYAPEQFADKRVYLQTIREESELVPEKLQQWLDEVDAERVVIEFNGMWMLDRLYTAMPENWMVYQEFMFADARSFALYNQNMRQLVYDKLKSCELVVFNRCTDAIDKMTLHKIVRGVSRRADIAYEDENGKVSYDDIQDPLPFDVKAPVIEIADEDFALWYRDLSEEPDKYENKTVRFKCKALVRKRLPAESFVVGRHVMTCCVDDIQFAGLICQWKNADSIEDETWMVLTAKINHKFNRAYGKKGPVLTFLEATPAAAPAQEVASFY